MNRLRSEEAANYERIVRACNDAGHVVTNRVREFLNRQIWQRDQALAKKLGRRLIPKLPETLQPSQIEALWQMQQYVVNLPAIAVEVRGGLFRISYFDDAGQDHPPEEIKRHFESAIHRTYPGMQIKWLPDPEKSNRKPN